MAQKNFTQKDTQKAFNMLKNAGVIDFVVNNENVTTVTVYRKQFGHVHTFKTNTWDCEDMHDLATLLFMYKNGEEDVTWDSITLYDASMPEYQALDMKTECIRKYVKDSYQLSKKLLDMVNENNSFAICKLEDLKGFESFKPEKCTAILLNGVYVTPKIYEYLKDYAWA